MVGALRELSRQTLLAANDPTLVAIWGFCGMAAFSSVIAGCMILVAHGFPWGLEVFRRVSLGWCSIAVILLVGTALEWFESSLVWSGASLCLLLLATYILHSEKYVELARFRRKMRTRRLELIKQRKVSG